MRTGKRPDIHGGLLVECSKLSTGRGQKGEREVLKPMVRVPTKACDMVCEGRPVAGLSVTLASRLALAIGIDEKRAA